MQDITPYNASEIVRALSADGKCKLVSPQNMYGMAAKQTIASYETDPKVEPGKGKHGGKVYFKGEAFGAWLKLHLEGKAPTEAVNRLEQAEQYLA